VRNVDAILEAERINIGNMTEEELDEDSLV
jgi:hypothetical protein